tara:strand:+ start:68 stop:280 length:213 start_codon:yes stop_codon:yes gene_type:complete
MISIEIKPRLIGIEPCQMCKATFNGKIKYKYHSDLSNTTLYICKKCAIREYYGTNYSKNKKYKKDKKLFE